MIIVLIKLYRMSGTVKYEMMIILTEEFNESELKTWAFNYAKALQNLSASEISVISRGKRDLAYLITSQKCKCTIESDIFCMASHLT